MRCKQKRVKANSQGATRRELAEVKHVEKNSKGKYDEDE